MFNLNELMFVKYSEDTKCYKNAQHAHQAKVSVFKSL